MKAEELFKPLDEGELLQSDYQKSPMPGKIVRVLCKVGQIVKKGESLISVESMKMEYLEFASRDVTIKEILA